MRGVFILFAILFCSPVFAQFKHVVIAESGEGFSPSTPNVAINHKDPTNIIVGIAPGRAYYTTDAGVTWSQSLTNSKSGGGEVELLSDAKGNMFYFQQGSFAKKDVNWLDKIICQEAEDGGKSWKEETFFTGNPSKQQSGFRVIAHSKKSILYSTWSQFDEYGSDAVGCQSNVFFSMSMNGGGKWTKPIQLNMTPGNCSSNPATQSAAAVNMEGRIYSAWRSQNTIFFDRSYDGGDTWLGNDLAIHKLKGDATKEVPGFGTVNSIVHMLCNMSFTRANGYLYVLYDDQKNPEESSINIMRSANRGDNWTTQVQLNQRDSVKYNFSPTFTIDPSTGYVYALYYGKKSLNDPETDLYLSYSTDGGDKFTEVRVNERSIVLRPQGVAEGFLSISAEENSIVAVWTDFQNDKALIRASMIKADDLRKIKN